MNRSHWWVAGALAAAVAVAVPQPSTGASHSKRLTKEIHEVCDLGPDGKLSLSNVNGDVRVTGWDQSKVEVTATKSANSQRRLDEAEVEINCERGRVTIEVDYPDHARYDHGDDPARVDFEIRVPRTTRLDDFHVVNGDVELKDISGRVNVSSVNGSVNGEKLSGDLDLSTVNGSVDLAVGGETNSIKLHSVNGMVSVYLPRDVNARLSASTVHGDIRGGSAFRAHESHFTGSSLDGIIGEGGGRIDLATVNGDIRIRREGGDDSHDDE